MLYQYKMTPDELRASVEAGMLPNEIAAKYGVTRQAVSHRAKHAGLMGRLKENRPTPKYLQPKKSELKYGMPMEMVTHLRAIGATKAFIQQRNNAKGRGIGWEMTLAQWWRIWDESGKWEQRGVGRDKCVMARCGDVGPYAVGNVFICTHLENTREGEQHSARAADGKFLPQLKNPTSGSCIPS